MVFTSNLEREGDGERKGEDMDMDMDMDIHIQMDMETDTQKKRDSCIYTQEGQLSRHLSHLTTSSEIPGFTKMR